GGLAHRLAVTGAQAELEGELDGADRDRATGIGEVSIERPCEQRRSRTDQRSVDHLEIVVQDRECGVSARRQRLESEARDGPPLLAGRLASATAVLRVHGLPPGCRC